MIKLIQILRLIQINKVLMQHAFFRSIFTQPPWYIRTLSFFNPWNWNKKNRKPRGTAIRETLESLGPIYVKFGQVLSTRIDLLPPDIIQELEKLQDKVKPFPGEQAKAIIEKAFNKNTDELFATFDINPLASASIAQVHAAQLKDGQDVIIKVLRPKILKVIRQDIAVLYLVANLTQRFWRHGKQLRPIELVQEFEQTIIDELDLTREAANASQLHRNFSGDHKMYVPKVYWDYVRPNIMVMERIHGVQISDIDTLKAAGTDMKKLAEYGVEIFFTQVFRDSFFHADMHPGNLFVDIKDPKNPIYLGVDFGIMGTLGPEDQLYLAKNLLAFFHRDYRQVAVLHVESGWVPPNTRIDQFEAAIRTVCEPIFEKPISEISFGHLLLNLFRTAKRFHMEVQPQLMLLQKTLLNVEALGRRLYPKLDLWETAKPFMEKWMSEQRGFKHLTKQLKQNLPDMIDSVLQAPELAFEFLHTLKNQQKAEQYHTQAHHQLAPSSKKHGFLLGAGLSLLAVAGFTAWTQAHYNPHLVAAECIIGLIAVTGAWILK